MNIPKKPQLGLVTNTCTDPAVQTDDLLMTQQRSRSPLGSLVCILLPKHSCASRGFITMTLFSFWTKKPRSLVILSNAHQTEICPQTVPAGFVCSGQAVPREGMCVCVLKRNSGYKWGCCVIVYMLCNKTYRVGS